MASLRSFVVNLAHIASLFEEFWGDMRAQKRRTMLTIFGIVWGTAAVVIMMAVGTSVKRGGVTTNPVDPARARSFVRAAGGPRGRR